MSHPVLRSLAALAAIALLAGAACTSSGTLIRSGTGPYVTGSDRPTTQSRQVAAFHQLEATSAVRVAFRAGAVPSVDVRTDDNLIPMITTTVADGRLSIGIDGSLSTKLGIDVTVVGPGLDMIIANASALIRAEGIAAPSLLVAATSAADVSVTGSVDRLDVHVLAGAQAKLAGLTAREVDVELAGAGRAEIAASDAVRGTVTSGSVLWIDGDPRSVEVRTDSAGEVKRR